MVDHMTNYLKAMKFEYPEVIPVKIGILPSAWMKYRENLSAIVEKYPSIFGQYDRTKHDYCAQPETYKAGEHVDAWGCVWSNVHEGCEAIVTHHPLPTREAVNDFKAPKEDVGLPHGFMYLRLADLRGFEELMIDFAQEPPELQMLIDIVLEYNVRQVKNILRQTDYPVLGFGDDLGMQTSLPISPEKWRKYLKPCYAKLYGLCREAGRWVYMHSDGQIYPIIADLIECGVNIINPQIRANGLDNLIQVCKGKVCVDLDLDRQMFPFCDSTDIDEHVHEVVAKLGAPEGGLMLTAECGPDVPLENIDAICRALDKYRSYYS
jgi:uroporphyrinogen decarboxylase